MRRLILTFMTMMAMHGGVGALQPHQPPPGAGFGAYMRTMVSQGSESSAAVAYTIPSFGEAVPRPPSASVKYGW